MSYHQAERRDERREVPLEGAESNPRHPVAPGPSPSEAVATQDLLHQVRIRLSADERYLADQRSHGRPWEEIATEFGVTPQAVRMRLTRALDRVARELSL